MTADMCHRCDSAPASRLGILCEGCRAPLLDLMRRYHPVVVADAEARAAGQVVRA